MADVIGPCSSLPGSSHRSVPAGMKCDVCGEPAVVRVQGETDSFGAELADLCQSCFDKEKQRVPWYKDPGAVCDWCRKAGGEAGLRPTRDPDEGSCGPVYHVCLPCLRKMNVRLEAELAQDEDDEEDDYDPRYDDYYDEDFE